ncbi:hypothetical protein [Alkalibacillus salilacus]|uniref:CDP-diglyceride synthetase n=1 Tax=Alkalibacillus salilacus TaxID=284582 RepID=A0ABT9VBA6_9BACI|nr:hypothetical protein [Alkalibacillus salilacus]MDQ0158194.1 CDP-diglyceride synthetase [Alkalibacillus salilacus]
MKTYEKLLVGVIIAFWSLSFLTLFDIILITNMLNYLMVSSIALTLAFIYIIIKRKYNNNLFNYIYLLISIIVLFSAITMQQGFISQDHILGYLIPFFFFILVPISMVARGLKSFKRKQ